MKEFIGNAHSLPEKEALVGGTKKAATPQLEAAELRAYRVAYSDLDILRHVNSIRYIQWIMDMFPN